MMPTESKLPDDWFAKAAKDLQRVDILLAADDIEGAGFHLQQAAEKYLKGFLLSKSWPLKRIHDLEVLLNEAMNYNIQFQDYLDACIMAREFYIEERYPFITESLPPERQELERAIQIIHEMIALILEETKQNGDPEG
jgi:HEPN domain-containing protein